MKRSQRASFKIPIQISIDLPRVELDAGEEVSKALPSLLADLSNAIGAATGGKVFVDEIQASTTLPGSDALVPVTYKRKVKFERKTALRNLPTGTLDLPALAQRKRGGRSAQADTLGSASERAKAVLLQRKNKALADARAKLVALKNQSRGTRA